VRLSARTLTEPEDALSIYLTPNVASRGQQVDPSGVLRIKWGTVELTAPWKVKI